MEHLEEHPLRALRDAGVVVTINSDDPPMFGTTLRSLLADTPTAARTTTTRARPKPAPKAAPKAAAAGSVGSIGELLEQSD